jgi:hypothetical protein
MQLRQAQVKYMPKYRNKNCRTAFYDNPGDIIRSDRFRRFQSLNGFADIRIRDRGKRQEFRGLRYRGKVYRTMDVVQGLKMFSEGISHSSRVIIIIIITQFSLILAY